NVTDASGSSGGIGNSGNGDSIFNPSEDRLVLSESYEPRGLSPTYRLQATNFAQKLHLNLGDKIYMRSVQDLAAVLLPDNSLVVIGPIHVAKGSTKPATKAQTTSLNASQSAAFTTTTTSTPTASTTANTTDSSDSISPSHATTATTTTTASHASGEENTPLSAPATVAAMQRRVVNLWLDMVCQIVVHDVLPPTPEQQAYAEADELIPNSLKHIAKEVKLNAPHNQYRYELAILDAVAEGDLDKVKRAFQVPKQGKFGVLGPTPLRSMQNHVHNLNSLVSRTAIKAGILPENAYALSDKFFMAAEACTTVEQCIELRTVCACAFAAMIKEYRAQHLKALPNLVHNATLLISRSLYEKCTVASLAQKLQVSPDHLERAFKQAMGLKLSTYIYQEKIKASQELLRDTTESISDIAKVLGFKAASHFARCFKHFTGLTPSEFRNSQANLNQG
ncbi:MAG TPA: helix-turn-helix transcriptional regulator, partial [Candidatus Anaerobiospirillum pullistercoris]|nr:helix-turn-helix transcriptional regulator [Candidatus Anaerobiospirillum pullistercoris]